ncbi:MAG: TolC family protein [Rhodocyclaceae bacterium]|nr:TolC family protein [Rhodocyclaceae bacterium]
MKRRWRAAPRLVAMAILLSPAVAAADGFDPFFTRDGISATPAKAMIPTAAGDEDPCSFAALGMPLTLLETIERALCHNPQTRLAWANAKAQAGQLGVAQSAYLPTVAATLGVSKQKVQSHIDGLPEFDSDARPTVRSGSLKMSFVLSDYGLRSANLDQAHALLDAANASHDAALQAAFAAAAQAYFETQTAQSTLDASREAERAAGESFKAAEAKHKAGVGALTDQLQAQTAYSKATLDRVTAEGEFQNALGTLATAMGLPPNTAVVIAARKEALPDIAFVTAIDQLIDDARQNHPALLAAQAQLKAADARVAAVKAEGRPTISLTSEIARNDQLAMPPSLGWLPMDTYNRSRSVGVQVSIPLFEGFGRGYRTQSAQGLAEAKAAELAEAEQRVTLEVWKNYQALHTGNENMKASEELVRNARQSFRVAQGRYKAGIGNILELLNAQSAQANAEQRRIKSISEWYTARLKLAASVGKLGLWAIQ